MRKLATVEGFNAILLFVAELNGYKFGTAEGKLAFGKTCWLDNLQPHEPHELIWANRLYKELFGFAISQTENKPYYWTVPVELDVGASMLQIIGALLGDRNLLTMTNVVSNGTLNDPWGQIKGVSRSKAKMVLMRQLYGSGQSASKILDDFEVEYTAEDILALETGLSTGGYGVANAFKNFLIGNCNLSETIKPVVWNEVLEVPCNRHHTHGEKPVVYSMLNSNGKVQPLIHWQVAKEADLKSFRRWTVTGLIHALDSQIVDYIMSHMDWALDIHDAVICNPEDVTKVKKLYAEALEAIYADRQSILNNYFASIGIRSNAKTQAEWAKVKSLITPLADEFKCSMWAMK
jgi:hypothetical protein